MKKFAGYLLLEWMMALSLSAMLFVCVVTVYVTSYRRYQLQQSLLLNQSIAMTIIPIIKREIQLAGYIGCAKLTDDFPIQSYENYELSVNNQLNGTATSFTVRHAEWPAAMLLTSMTNLSDMTVSDHVGLNDGNIAIISDCTHAEIFRVAHRSSHKGYQRIEAAEPLHYRFAEGAEVSRLAINTYFLRDTKRKHRDASPVMALSLQDIHHQVTDIVDDVDAMRVIIAAQHAAIDLHVSSQSVKRWWHLYATLS